MHFTRHLLFPVCFLLTAGINAQPRKDQPAVDYVNPIIGTAFAGFAKGLEGGGTMPCVNRPFAMTNFVAQTAENKMGRMSYVYEDSTVTGFLASHQPTVWMGDYGYVSVMPQVGPLKVLPKERALPYRHSDETARPYYYSVNMQSPGGTIRGEIAGASRCGIFRFTFPRSEQAHLIIQGINLNPELKDWANDIQTRLQTLRGFVQVNPEQNEITGYNPDRQSAQLGPALPNFKGYFIIRFSKPFHTYGTWNNDSIHPAYRQQYGTRMGAYISFHTAAQETIQVTVATSFISLEQARMNLEKEIGRQSFEQVVNATRQAWQQQLGRLQVHGISAEQKTIFYTALFHTMLFPREFSEYGRYYSAFDDQVHEGESYNDYSLWDTFRAEHPLLTLLQPERVGPMVQSLLQMYQQGGWVPMWPNPTYTNIMIGTHGDAVIADALVKGFTGFDKQLAYAAMRKNSFTAPDGDTLKKWGDRDLWTSYEARGGLTYYHRLGYVPSDKTKESVSRTIEYSIDDYCVAQAAALLGKTADEQQLRRWSENYRNVYNPATGFAAPRKADGSWDSNTAEGFTEGSNWTYTFGALHDIPGMINIMGGPKAFAAKLTENFEGGHYRPDNEPGHHYIYLFNYCGMPWKTQELIRRHTSAENFRNAAIGINGNDDCGQTSAWYLFSVMGFYPVTPASGEYVIGAPQYPAFTLTLPGGKKLEIEARNISETNKYVQAVTLNGRPLSSFTLSHKDLVQGGKLVFTMTSQPVQ